MRFALFNIAVVMAAWTPGLAGCSKKEKKKPPGKTGTSGPSGKSGMTLPARRTPVPTCDEKDDFLTKQEKITLLKLARRAAEASVRSGGKLNHEQLIKGLTITDALKKPMGAFVTLHKHGRLRGCIGYLQPVEALFTAVISNARSAALRDRRFQPVSTSELPDIDVEVSVLSVPVPVASAEDIKVGCHGIILINGGRRATYLPHVAPQQKWNREQALKHLSYKGWRRPDIWKQPETKFKVYTALVFDEKQLGLLPAK